MAKVYQYDNLGFYVGETEDYNGPMPHNCTNVAPSGNKLEQYQRYCFKNGKWVENCDYRGASGWIGPQQIRVTTPKLPEGFSFEQPELLKEEKACITEAERNAKRTQMKDDFFEAFMSGDTSKIASLQAEYQALMAATPADIVEPPQEPAAKTAE